MNMNLTFDQFPWDTIMCIEDPVHQSYIDCEVYLEMYGDLMKTFDGSDADSYIDCFYTRSPVNSFMLIFLDEDSRLDFQHLAMEAGLIPRIQEICEGESKKDKDKRTRQVQVQASQPKREKKPVVSREDKHRLRSDQMLKTMDSILAKLAMEEDPDIRSKMNQKLQRIQSELQNPKTQ